MMTLALAIQAIAQKMPNKDAVVFYSAPDAPAKVMSFKDLSNAIDTAIASLLHEGIEPGETIGIIPALNTESLIAIIAAASIGTAHPVNILLAPKAIAAQFKMLNIKWVISLGTNPVIDPASHLEAHGISAQNIIEIPVGPDKVRFRNWSDIMIDRSDYTLPERSAHDPAIAFGTGGTTGAPKLALLSTANIIAAATAYADGIGIQSNDRLLTGLPLFHVGGLIDATLGTLLKGGTVVFPTAFGMRNQRVMERTWQLIDDAEITFLGLVPTSIAAILTVPKGTATLSTLRGVLTGSAPIAPELTTKIEEITNAPLIELYGMTETSGIISCNSVHNRKLGTTGRPVQQVEVSIGTPGSGHDQSVRAEIYVKGPNVFLGYTDAKLTAEVLQNGWMATGDLGHLDDEGRLIVGGRNKDVIIRSGHNIDPVMIEACALEHSDVLFAAAIGFPDEYAGELPVLYITPKPDRRLDVEEIRTFVGNRVNEPAARPKRVFIMDPMPLTAMGKIFKPTLRENAIARADAGESVSTRNKK